jgi:hypothetical protein
VTRKHNTWCGKEAVVTYVQVLPRYLRGVTQDLLHMKQECHPPEHNIRWNLIKKQQQSIQNSHAYLSQGCAHEAANKQLLTNLTQSTVAQSAKLRPTYWTVRQSTVERAYFPFLASFNASLTAVNQTGFGNGPKASNAKGCAANLARSFKSNFRFISFVYSALCS